MRTRTELARLLDHMVFHADSTNEKIQLQDLADVLNAYGVKNDADLQNRLEFFSNGKEG